MTVLVWRGKCLPMRPGKGSFPGVTCSPEAKPAPFGAAGRTGQARKLEITAGAVKELRGLPPKHCKQVALEILELLQNATPHDSAALTGHYPWRRIDVGEYRVIFWFDDAAVYVPLVGKRNDDEIYKRLRR